ncbi:MAG: AAA family ATPase [Deltaproteobacteria bacterium]|nr:AAA family ATPase [Deltaproteobacteria bacterium]
MIATRKRRLQTIQVTGLFRIFDHTIKLNQRQRITFVHGVNGTGKTAVLRMVKGLFGGTYDAFRRVPFDTFIVTFDDSTRISVECSPSSRKAPRRDIELMVRVKSRNGRDKSIRVPCTNDGDWVRFESAFPRDIVEDILPFLARKGRDSWRNRTTGETMSLLEVFEQYGNHLSDYHADKPPQTAELDKIQNMLSVRLIETRRLDKPDDASPRRHIRRRRPAASTVDRYAEDMAHRVQVALSQYAATSQELDRSFPNRLLSTSMSMESKSRRQTMLDIASVEEKRQRLVKLGILAHDTTFSDLPDGLDDDKLSLLSMFTDDTQEKLAVFDDLSNRISLFLEIMNSRLLYKHVAADLNKGFVVESDGGHRLRPAELSSGEQHELVLAYELIFMLRDHSLVLIDEPELSLHLSWQQQFFPDLQRMTKLSKFDAVVATHSADIIGDRWDLAVALRGPST